MGADEFTLHCAQQRYWATLGEGLAIVCLPLLLSPIELSTVGNGAPSLYRTLHDRTGQGISCIYLLIEIYHVRR